MCNGRIAFFVCPVCWPTGQHTSEKVLRAKQISQRMASTLPPRWPPRPPPGRHGRRGFLWAVAKSPRAAMRVIHLCQCPEEGYRSHPTASSPSSPLQPPSVPTPSVAIARKFSSEEPLFPDVAAHLCTPTKPYALLPVSARAGGDGSSRTAMVGPKTRAGGHRLWQRTMAASVWRCARVAVARGLPVSTSRLLRATWRRCSALRRRRH